MRKMLMLLGLAAMVAISQVGSAGATGGLPGVGLPGVEVECKTVFVKANVGADASAMKKITLNGKTLVDKDINFTVFRVVKTVALEVCVSATANVVLKLEPEVKVDTEDCGKGMTGSKLILKVGDVADVDGSIYAKIKLAVSDQDTVGPLKPVEFEKVFGDEVTVPVQAGVLDAYKIELDACVEASVS